jgi:hypothetical protein
LRKNADCLSIDFNSHPAIFHGIDRRCIPGQGETFFILSITHIRSALPVLWFAKRRRFWHAFISSSSRAFPFPNLLRHKLLAATFISQPQMPADLSVSIPGRW